MPKCRQCGEDHHIKDLMTHYREKHPEKWAEIRRRQIDNTKLMNAGKGKKQQTILKAFKEVEEPPATPPSKNGATEPKHREQTESTTVRVQLVARSIQVDARILLFYNLCRQRFADYAATEGEWLLDVVSRYFAEHAEEFGLNAEAILGEVRRELEAPNES